MPLVQIVCNPDKIHGDELRSFLKFLTAEVAKVLSCEDGGVLSPEDIMIEVSHHSEYDLNSKDLHIRIWAHDYPSRRGENLEHLDESRVWIGARVQYHFTQTITWYVWVLLATTSYGSDSEP